MPPSSSKAATVQEPGARRDWVTHPWAGGEVAKGEGRAGQEQKEARGIGAERGMKAEPWKMTRRADGHPNEKG